MPAKHNNTSDKKLWLLLKNNDKTAFTALYQRHTKTLFHFGLKHSPDREIIKDTIQELFIDFWQKRTALSDVQNVKVYLLQAFRYKLLRAISISEKLPVLELEPSHFEVGDWSAFETEVLAERKQLVQEKLAELPRRQREVIHLRYFQELKNDEIAEVLKVNYQSVGNLLHRALKKLKSIL